jgi:hypothetical protein
MVSGVYHIKDGGWRVYLDGEEIGEWGIRHDAIVAYNTHVAWLGLDRPLKRVPDEDPQGTFMKRMGISWYSHPPGGKFPSRVRA